MGNGFLQSKVQPFKQDNFILGVLEQERALKLQGIVEKNKKRQETLGKLFENLESPDVEGKFLADSVSGMEEVKRAKIDLWNLHDQGKIGEADYLLAQSQLDRVPLKYQAANEAVSKKLEELSKGDDVMNKEDLNRLALMSSTYQTKFDPKTRNMVVTYKEIDDEGKEVTVTKPIDTLISEVSNLQAVPKLDDFLDVSNKAFTGFQTAERTNYLNPNMSVNIAGIGVGDTMQKYDDTMTGIIGTKEDRTNPYVLKEIVRVLGDVDVDDEIYDRVYDNMYESQKHRIKDVRKDIYRSPSASSTAGKSPLDKAGLMVVEDDYGNPVTSITVGGNKVGGGYHAKFNVSNREQKIPFGSNELGDISIPDDLSKEITITDVFVTPKGDSYVKVLIPPKDIIEAGLYATSDKKSKEENAEIMKSLIGLKEKKDTWYKLNNEAKAQLSSNVFEAKKMPEVYEYLNEKFGSSQTVEETNTEETNTEEGSLNDI